MTILLVAGSPSSQSRSSALLQHIGAALATQDIDVEEIHIRTLPAQALLNADVAHPALAAAIAQVARSQAVVFATPIYKAAYSGVLKTFLDRDTTVSTIILPTLKYGVTLICLEPG